MNGIKTVRDENIMRHVEAYRQALLQSGGIKIAESPINLFRVRSGTATWIYVDHGDLLCQPETNIPYVSAMSYYIQSAFPQNTTILVNADSKSSPQTTGAIAVRAAYRQIVTIPQEVQNVEKGTNRRVRIPQHLAGLRDAIIVDDVLTSGATALNIAELVRSELRRHMSEETASNVNFHLVVGLVRNPDKSVQMLGNHGITAHWFLTLLDDVISQKWSDMTEVQKIGIMEEFPLSVFPA